MSGTCCISLSCSILDKFDEILLESKEIWADFVFNPTVLATYN
jgi:hypothetical protein